MFEQLCSQWLQCRHEDFESQWNSELGERTRHFLEQHPHLGRVQSERSFLSAALNRLHMQPQAPYSDWVAHSILALYLRQWSPHPEADTASQQAVYAQAPASWRKWLTQRLEQRHLQVFPAVAEPQITLVIPTYQRLEKLKRAVASVQAQSDPHWRLLIGDDASDDGTQAWCEQLCREDERVQYLRNDSNQGCWPTFNRLYRNAESEWVSNLADDDLLMPEWLASMRRLIQNFPWIGLAGGGYYSLHLIHGQLKAKQSGPYFEQDRVVDPQRELQRCALEAPVFGGGMTLRRSVLRQMTRHSGLLGDWEYSGWDWWIIAQALARYEVAYAPEIVAAYVNRTDTYQHTYDWDWGKPFAFLCQQMLDNYEALFGPRSFPAELLRYQLDMVIEPNIVQSFRDSIGTLPNAEALEQALQQQEPAWHCFRSLRQDTLPQCPTDLPYLVDERSVSGRTGGQIPGIAQHKIRPELQRLIQDLLHSA